MHRAVNRYDDRARSPRGGVDQTYSTLKVCESTFVMAASNTQRITCFVTCDLARWKQMSESRQAEPPIMKSNGYVCWQASVYRRGTLISAWGQGWVFFDTKHMGRGQPIPRDWNGRERRASGRMTRADCGTGHSGGCIDRSEGDAPVNSRILPRTCGGKRVQVRRRKWKSRDAIFHF